MRWVPLPAMCSFDGWLRRIPSEADLLWFAQRQGPWLALLDAFSLSQFAFNVSVSWCPCLGFYLFLSKAHRAGFSCVHADFTVSDHSCLSEKPASCWLAFGQEGGVTGRKEEEFEVAW